MKIEIVSATNEDHRDAIAIYVNGERVMNFYDGEPEDNSLCRNFGDIYGIGELIDRVIQAERSGDGVELIEKELPSWDAIHEYEAECSK